jgi:hypothetical protein
MSIPGSSKGGGSNAQFNVTGGGSNAPWSWGVSDFDQSQIDTATGENATAIGNRYNQLGLGGSTMEGQDQGTIPTPTGGNIGAGKAVTGQEQTANVGNAALNPALQPQFNEQIGQNTSGQSLGTLAGLAGKAVGAGGTAAAGDAAGDAAIDDAAATFLL